MFAMHSACGKRRDRTRRNESLEPAADVAVRGVKSSSGPPVPFVHPTAAPIVFKMYDPLDPELVTARLGARDLCQSLNASRESDEIERRRILKELFGAGGNSVWMQPPFFCDYGSNITLGERVFFNFNCIVLDVCPVSTRFRVV